MMAGASPGLPNYSTDVSVLSLKPGSCLPLSSVPYSCGIATMWKADWSQYGTWAAGEAAFPTCA